MCVAMSEFIRIFAAVNTNTMKKLFIISALIFTFGWSIAQEVKTYSVYDSNQSNTIEIDDVTAVVEQIKNDVSAASTPQYVTAEDLSTMFGSILSKLESLEAAVTAIKEKMDSQTTDDETEATDNHSYVDLGLTDAKGNPIYWATCNVGSNTPEGSGQYFAWGATSGFTSDTSDGHLFNWANCPFNGNNSSYSASSLDAARGNGILDSNNNLVPAYDAATTLMGKAWRMPTKAELEQLVTSCTWSWTTQYDVDGYKVTGPNGNSIFLPAAGSRVEGEAAHYRTTGNYWSRTIDTTNPDGAYCLSFESDKKGIYNTQRSFGLPIRAVRK